MLTLKELKDLLALNELLTIKAIDNNESLRRLQELAFHKSIVKDLIIEALQIEINNYEYKQLSKYGKVS